MKTWIAILLACSFILTVGCEKSASAITNVDINLADTIVVVDTLYCHRTWNRKIKRYENKCSVVVDTLYCHKTKRNKCNP